MTNEEILERISAEDGNEEEERIDEKMLKFLVFDVNGKRYALQAEAIREIVMDIPLFFVPFVPPYVRGLINRHGEPYTVLDLNVLFEKAKLESSTYLILNRENDQVSLLITDVLETFKAPESAVHPITASDGQESFLSGSITSGDHEILIMNLSNVMDRLRHDLDAE